MLQSRIQWVCSCEHSSHILQREEIPILIKASKQTHKPLHQTKAGLDEDDTKYIQMYSSHFSHLPKAVTQFTLPCVIQKKSKLNCINIIILYWFSDFWCFKTGNQMLFSLVVWQCLHLQNNAEIPRTFATKPGLGTGSGA